MGHNGTNGAVTPEELARRVRAEVELAGGEPPPDPERAGAVGATMFDLPGSDDLGVTVLLPREHLHHAPAQALVRIVSRPDGRRYLGVISAGPFAQPDSLRGDSPVLVTVATRGVSYLPPFHGRVQVTLLGEELADGTLAPPRLRPLPNSPVFVLSDEEAARLLRAVGDIRLGLAVGHEGLVVGVPSDQKLVLPRHTAVLGTTGAGKSTTIAGLVKQAQAAGLAVVLLDVEGEYAHLHEPTADRRMLAGLRERGLKPGGVPAGKMTLYHLVGRDTANPNHPRRRPFSLQFARLSPYAAIEILDLSEAQQERFLKAYDVCKEVLRDVGVFPARNNAEQEQMVLELDEMERGYPRLTLTLLLDVVAACLAQAEKPPKPAKAAGKGAKWQSMFEEGEEPQQPTFTPRSPILATAEGRKAMWARIHAAGVPGNAISWRALLGRLGRLNRLRVFDRAEEARFLNYRELLQPGSVSVIDLSDTGMSELSNIVIADLLRGLQDAQDEAYAAWERGKAEAPARALVIVEEAHEFLGAERIEQMPVLFGQVARLSKRGR